MHVCVSVCVSEFVYMVCVCVYVCVFVLSACFSECPFLLFCAQGEASVSCKVEGVAKIACLGAENEHECFNAGVCIVLFIALTDLTQ